MARTRAEIYNSIIAAKQSLADIGALMPQYNLTTPPTDNPFVILLQEISTLSRVGRWRLQAFIMSYILWFHENLWDAFKAEVEDLAARSIVGTTKWYADQVKAFQYNFQLLFDTTYYRYYYNDTTSASAISSRIVGKVSVTEVLSANFNGLTIKVASDDGNGNLQPFTSAQLTALGFYVDRIKFAGVRTAIISEASDKVKSTMTIYYDGTLDLTDFSTTVVASLKDFLKNSIEFDGTLYLNGFTDPVIGTRLGWVDSIQQIDGCRGVKVVSLQARADASPLYVDVTFDYQPDSGYYELNTADTLITYVAV